MIATVLDGWYASGHVSAAQYGGLIQWRDDGGGIRRKGRRQAPQEPRQRDPASEPDFKRDAARQRHRQAARDDERLSGDTVARSLHRLVMLDGDDQRLEHVQRGAAIVWCHYSAA